MPPWAALPSKAVLCARKNNSILILVAAGRFPRVAFLEPEYLYPTRVVAYNSVFSWYLYPTCGRVSGRQARHALDEVNSAGNAVCLLFVGFLRF